MSVNSSNLNSKSRRVYLDKFVTLPHLPSNPGSGPGFNKKIDYVSPNLDHTGIRTAFQEPVARPVKPNGRLTYDYKLNAYIQVTAPARTLAKLERNKIRGKFEKNSTYEERLLALEHKRQALSSACEQQLEAEADFLLPPEESRFSSSHASGQSKRSRAAGGKSQKIWTAKPRPKQIFSQQGIVDCLLDNCDMSICGSTLAPPTEGGESEEECLSRGGAHPLDGGDSFSSLRSGSSWRSQGGSLRRVRGGEGRWHPEAVRRVFGEEQDQDEDEADRRQRPSRFGASLPVTDGE